jgi:hypothetical protein
LNKGQSLVNYWPFDDGTANDAAGQKHLINPSDKVHYTSDRFGAPSSALALNTGYIQAPPGNYLAGAFTVTFWIYLKAYHSGTAVFSFGDALNDKNVYGFFGYGGGNKKLSLRFDSTVECLSHLINVEVALNYWTHVVMQYDNFNTAKIYINGQKQIECNYFLPNLHMSSNTNLNYIGKTFAVSEGNLDAVLDDLKFYNRVLMDSEIQSDLFSFYSYTQSKSTTPKSYFGCYVTTTGRDGLLSSRRNDFSLIKVDTCRQKCKDNKYLYAALKNGYQF